MKKMTASLGLTALVLATTSSAWASDNQVSFGRDDHQCEVSLNYDISVEPRKLVISEDKNELYRIELGQLYIDGTAVSLNDKQQEMVNQYADEVSNQLPEVIDLVHDAVDIASTAVSMALTPLLGDASGAKIDEMMDALGQRIDKVAYQNGDKFYLGATESTLEDTFGKEFEKEMEQVVQSSIGSMMMTLGSEMMNGDGDSFEEKMNAFSAKMEKVGDDIEVQLEQQATDLEARADTLCDNFQQLVVLESQLRQAVPELSDYPLLQAKQKRLLE